MDRPVPIFSSGIMISVAVPGIKMYRRPPPGVSLQRLNSEEKVSSALVQLVTLEVPNGLSALEYSPREKEIYCVPEKIDDSQKDGVYTVRVLPDQAAPKHRLRSGRCRPHAPVQRGAWSTLFPPTCSLLR